MKYKLIKSLHEDGLIIFLPRYEKKYIDIFG